MGRRFKDKPAKGEYMIGQTASSVLVQISPASYDLSGKTVKVVNTKGEELPIKLGKATPVTDARAASPVGLYEFPVESIVVMMKWLKNTQIFNLFKLQWL